MRSGASEFLAPTEKPSWKDAPEWAKWLAGDDTFWTWTAIKPLAAWKYVEKRPEPPTCKD